VEGVFWVTLPLARRGVLAGVVLGFARALGEFGATMVVAGNIPGRTTTLPLAIYTNIILGDNDAALQLIAISFALALGAVFLGSGWRGRCRNCRGREEKCGRNRVVR